MEKQTLLLNTFSSKLNFEIQLMIGIIIFNLDLKMHLSNGESDCGENDSSLRGSDSDEHCALAELLGLFHNIENAKDQIRERILP